MLSKMNDLLSSARLWHTLLTSAQLWYTLLTSVMFCPALIYSALQCDAMLFVTLQFESNPLNAANSCTWPWSVLLLVLLSVAGICCYADQILCSDNSNDETFRPNEHLTRFDACRRALCCASHQCIDWICLARERYKSKEQTNATISQPDTNTLL